LSSRMNGAANRAHPVTFNCFEASVGRMADFVAARELSAG
jgi:hypothetical protein